MDCEKVYFFLTKNFKPNYEAEFLPMKDGVYKHIVTGSLYKKSYLFDFGWGQELGYVQYPEPTFEQLIALIEYVPYSIQHNPFYHCSKRLRKLNALCANNALGAISIIMQAHVDELIAFLAEKVETDYFENKYIRKRFQRFAFDKEQAKAFGILVGCSVGTQSYEQIFQERKEWKKISNKVVAQIYRK